MQRQEAHIRLNLDTDEPIALSDFVGQFVGLGSQFEKYLSQEHPDLKSKTEFYVQEVRKGSIEADLAWFAASPAIGAAGASAKWAIDKIDQAQILGKFIEGFKERLSPYFRKGGRAPNATKGELNDFNKTVRAITRDRKGAVRLEAAVFKDGDRNIEAQFKFTSEEAQIAEAEISDHIQELDARSDINRERVLLRFVRPSAEAGKPGKKGGERGVIDSLAKRALPVLYASTLTEEKLKYELTQMEGNVFRALFDVSVNVELNANDRPVAYRVTELHNIIEDPDYDMLDTPNS